MSIMWAGLAWCWQNAGLIFAVSVIGWILVALDMAARGDDMRRSEPD